MTDTTALVEELARAINHACCLDLGIDPDGEWQAFIPEATATLPIIAREVEKARAEASVNQCEMPEVAAMRYIEDLRSDYGTVTILPDNDEANTKAEQMAIDCCGEWTNWQDQRFYGESVIQCLAKAVEVRAKSAAIRATEVTK